jgi:hypothetical protein
MANEFVTRTGLIVSGSTYLPSATSASKGYILSFDDSTKQVYYMSTASVTVTVPGSDTQIIYNNGGAFGAASNFVFSGSNVGIGTTSPLTLLDLRASNNSAITPLASVPDTATTLLIGNTGTNGVLALGHDNDGHPWLQGRSVLANQAPTVILLNPLGGNVGIGTTSPTTTLYVKATGSLIETGSLTVDTTAVSNTQVFMDLKGTAGSDQYLLRHYRSTTLQNYILDDQGRLNFYTKPLTAYTGSTAFGFFADSTVTGNIVSFGSVSGNTQMVISASGNVGIGTTSPSSLLHVSGTTPTVTIEGSSTNSAKINLVGSFTTWALENQYVNGATNDMFRIYNSQLGANAITINRLSNNVGIGTTTPSEILDVQKAGTVAVRVYNTSSTADAYFDAKNSTGDAFFGINATGQYLYTSNNIPTLFYNSGSERMRITNAGDVGIGTTSPSAKLHVSSTGETTLTIDSTSSGTARINLTGAGGGAGAITSTVGGLYLNASGNNPLTFNTSGSERMRVAGDGNVGIGLTNPNYKLVVYESNTGESVSARFETTHPNLNYILLKNGGGSYNHYLQTNSNTLALSADENGSTGIINLKTNNITGLTVNSSQNVGIGKTSPNAKLDVSGSVLISGSLTVSGSSTFTNIGPAVFTGSITQNASTASFGGLVGIGTTTPSTTLDVNGRAIVGGGLSGNALSISTSVGTYTFNGYDLLTPSSFIITAGSSGYLTLDGYPVIFKVSGGEKMRVNTNGNVGIGTTAPNSTFQVSKGGVTFQVTDTNKTANNTFSVYGLTQTSWAIATGNSGSFSSGEKIVITDSGNVGIGTTTPSATLEVGGNVKATSFTGSFSGSVSAPGSTTQIVYNSGGALAADSGLVYSGSAVGIGTATPAYKLDINGTGRFASSLDVDSYILTRNKLQISNGRLFELIGTSDALNIYDGSAGASRIYISGSGNVGIGTTSPDTPLVVQGGAAGTGGWNRTATLSATYPGLIFNSNGTKWGGMAYDYSAAMRFWVNASNNDIFAGTLALSILNNGNVGIGNSDPAYKLDVNGTGRFVGNSGAPALQITDGGSTFGVLGISGSQSGDVNWLVISGYPSAGNFTIRQSDTVNALVIQKTTGAATFSAGVTATSFTGSFSGSVSAPGSTTQIVYNSGGALAADSGLVYSGSNVGIGTTSPTYKLHVSSSNNNDGIAIHYPANNSTLFPFYVGDSSNGIYARLNASEFEFKRNGAANTIKTVGSSNNLTLESSTNLIFNTNGASERMRIDTSGNVGIGNSPQTGFKLDVNGSTVTRGEIYSNSDIIGFGANENYKIAELGNTWLAKTTGAVGIGTTSPAAKLHVSGASATIRVDDTAAGNPGFEIMSGGSTQASLISNTSTGNTTLLVPAGSLTLRAAVGNVFITGSTFQTGSGTITGDLTVGGTITAQKLNVQQVTSSVIYSSGSNVFGNSLANTQTFTGSLQVTGSTHYLLGNVGINNATPAYSLDISGTPTNAILNLAKSDGDQFLRFIGGSGGSNQLIQTSYNLGIDVGGAGNRAMTILSGSGNVGIGTTTPDQKLELFSSSDVALRIHKNSVGEVIMGISGSAGADATQFITNTNGFDFRGDSNTFPGGGSSRLFISSSGNVGIGTTTPFGTTSNRTVLSVNGTTDVSINVGTGGTQRAYLYGASTYADLGTIGSLPLLFSPNNTEAMRITSAGSVGIGISSPQYKLDVSGSVNIADYLLMTGNNIYLGNTKTRLSSDGNGEFGINYNSSATSTYSFGVYDGGTTQLFHIGRATGNVYVSGSLSVKTTSTAGTGLTVGGSTILLSFAEIQQGNPLYLYSSGNTYYSNIAQNGQNLILTPDTNVGIGTTSPTAKLEVNGNVKATSFTGSFSGSISAPGSTTQIVYNSGGALAADSGLVYSGSRVGIGTTTPVSSLQVNRSSQTYNSPTASGALVVSNLAGGAAVLDIGMDATNLAYLQSRYIDNSAVYQLLLNPGGGNVGIGTTTPSTALTVAGAISSSGATYVGGNLSVGTTYNGFAANIAGTTYVIGANVWVNDGYGYGNANSANTGFYPSSSTAISINSGGNTRMFIASGSGNVGIGTSSPSAKLQVEGTIQTYNNLHFYSSNNARVLWKQETGPGDSNLYVKYNDGASDSIKITTTSGGNVGIGTTSPNATLQVANTTSGNAFSMIGSNSKEFVSIAYLGYLRSRASDTNGANMHFSDNENTKRMEMAVGSTSMAWYSDALASNFLYFYHSTGNVSIGTSNSSQRLHVSGAIAVENQGTTTIESTTFSGSLTGNTNIAFVPTGSFKAAFFDYYVASGSISMRAGTVMSVHNNSTSRYTDTSTADIGNTAPVDFSTSVVGGNLVLTANIASGTWEVKTAYRAL